MSVDPADEGQRTASNAAIATDATAQCTITTKRS